LLSLSKRFTDMWVGASVREETLHDAVFADSPLVARDHYFSAGIAISWIFARSDTLVDVDAADTE